MTLDESKKDDDVLDEGYGVSILTEQKLSSYLEGATIDFINSPNGGGFEIRTANPSSGCGGSCGGC